MNLPTLARRAAAPALGALAILAAPPAGSAAPPEPRWGPLLSFPAPPTAADAVGAAISSSGRALAGLQLPGDTFPIATPAVRLRAGSRRGWGPVVRLAAEGPLVSGPWVYLNRRGQGLAVWEGDTNAAARLERGRWLRARLIGLGDVRLAGLADDGSARAVQVLCADREDLCTVNVAVQPAARAAWRPLEGLQVRGLRAGSRPSEPAVALGADGTVLAAWVRPADGHAVAALLTPTSARWGAAEDVSGAPALPRTLVPAVGPTGRAALLWSLPGPGGRDAMGLLASFRGSAWSPRQTVVATDRRRDPADQEAVAIDAAGRAVAAWTTGGAGGRLLGALSAGGPFGPAAPIVSYASGDSVPAATATIANGRAQVFWSVQHGPGDNSVGSATRVLGAPAWRAADYASEQGFTETALATAPNGRAISIDDNLTVQDFDALPYAARPRVRNLRAAVVGGRIRVRFDLSARAQVRAFALNTVYPGLQRGEISPRRLAAGRRRLTLARVPRGRYVATVRACTVTLGCVDATSRAVQVR